MRLSFRGAPAGSPRLRGPRAPTSVPGAPGPQRGGSERESWECTRKGTEGWEPTLPTGGGRRRVGPEVLRRDLERAVKSSCLNEMLRESGLLRFLVRVSVEATKVRLTQLLEKKKSLRRHKSFSCKS